MTGSDSRSSCAPSAPQARSIKAGSEARAGRGASYIQFDLRKKVSAFSRAEVIADPKFALNAELFCVVQVQEPSTGRRNRTPT